MNTQYWKLVPGLLLLGLLSACGGSNDNGDSASNGNSGGGTSTSASRVQAIATTSGTAEPTDVNDPSGLQQDINSVFGNPDSEPVAVNSGDDLQTVLNRAAGN